MTVRGLSGRGSGRRARAGMLLAPAALVLLLTTACSAAEDAVSGAVDQAACSLARDTFDGVESRVRAAAEDLAADPQAARRELTAVREALAAAETSLSGETREQVVQAREAVDQLLDESREAAEGAVDEQAVAEARDRLDRAVRGLGNIC